MIGDSIQLHLLMGCRYTSLLMMTTQEVTNSKTLTSPWSSHVCNRKHASYALQWILCIMDTLGPTKSSLS